MSTFNHFANMKQSLLKSIQRQEDLRIKNAQHSITHIQPLIHRLTLGGSNSNQLHSFTKLTCITAREATPEEMERMPNYTWIGFGSFEGHRVTLYQYPVKAYLPPFMFSMNDLTPEEMMELAYRIPGLNVSSGEYAIDFYCPDPGAAAKVIHLLIRYCHFPYKDAPVLRGGHYDGLEADREENAVYHVPNRGGKELMERGEFTKKEYIIYERGPDEKKRWFGQGKRKRKGWAIKDIDRVRFEKKEKGGSRLMSERGLKSFDRFALGPKLEFIMASKIRFRAFRRSSVLPSYGFPYAPKDEGGVHESFQQVYIDSKDQVKNIAQHTVSVPLMQRFKSQIKSAMRRFDEEWEKSIR